LTGRALIREGAQRLGAAGRAQARHEAEWLLGRLAGSTPLELYLRETPIPAPIAERFFSQLDARSAGVPLQYLLGEAEFFGAPFFVSPGVFIPRPETETLVEHTLPVLQERYAALGRPLRLLDLGTGSGCIAVTLARAVPACVVVGVELSWVALRVAQRNVQRHGLAARVHLVQGRWTEAVRGAFDGVIANPPYVPSATVDRLPLDVRQEPRMGLDGGSDGMQDLIRLMAQAPRIVSPGGCLALECGEGHVPVLVRLASRAAWVHRLRALQDLAGRPRGVLIVRGARRAHDADCQPRHAAPPAAGRGLSGRGGSERSERRKGKPEVSPPRVDSTRSSR